MKRKQQKPRPRNRPLHAIRADAAGIDLGSTEHYVALPPEADGSPRVRSFRTTTPGLQELAGWLLDRRIGTVAMESTGVYWIPVYELLESKGLEVLLVNTRQLKSVPGRKSDVADCQWIQQLHACGLLRGSFRPGEAVCRCRALARQAANLVAERAKSVQWMQKALDQMNIQVHRALSDITGKTGMRILRAIAGGERDPGKLADLRDRRCKKSAGEIAEHLTGNWRDEHLFNLKTSLELYDVLSAQIEAYEARLLSELAALSPEERRGGPPPHPNKGKEKAIRNKGQGEARDALWRFCGADLTRIDGIGTKAALCILTEVGFDLSAFPDEKAFVSWLRLCPRRAVSGGKPLKKRQNGTGSNRVAAALRMAAVSLQNSKTALGARFRSVARRKCGATAVFALARHLAILVYRMLRWGRDYLDEGVAAYEKRFQERRIKSLKNSAKAMGFSLVAAESPT